VKILQQSIQKEAKANYLGNQETTVTSGLNVQRTEQLVKRKAPNKQRFEYLSPPRLRGDILIDNGTTTWHFFHSQGVVEQSPSAARAAKQLVTTLVPAVKNGSMTVEYLGEDTIAGRKTYGVRISPARTPDRHREVWLDQEFGVVLRLRDLAPNGRVSEYVFKRIEFLEVPPADSEFVWEKQPGVAEVPRSLGPVIPLPRAHQLANRTWGALMLPKYLPPRFRLISAHEVRIEGQPIIHLRYSDGEQTISLFQGLVGGPPPVRGLGGRKNNLFPFRRGRLNLLIVGPLPVPELQKIADSIQ
jgi:outer membrane lipoprotein-sorting protein